MSDVGPVLASKNPATPAKAGAYGGMDPGLRREGEEGRVSLNII